MSFFYLWQVKKALKAPKSKNQVFLMNSHKLEAAMREGVEVVELRGMEEIEEWIQQLNLEVNVE